MYATAEKRNSNQIKTKKGLRTWKVILISSVLGLAWFLFLFGKYPLYVHNVNWIYNSHGDIFQTQLGWEWFRQEPWQFPIGRIADYGYPFGTTISFMNSIPLFAILFKIFSNLLVGPIQYFGIWLLLSLILQFFFGFKILSEFSLNVPGKLLGSSLLVLSPPLIYQCIFHDALAAQWILLAAIWFVILEYKKKLWGGSWAILFAAAMLIHLYYVPMIVPIWMISLYFKSLRIKNKRFLFIDLFSIVFLVAFLGYCLGFFFLQNGSYFGLGYNTYSWNLNGFINPLDKSAIFTGLPLRDGWQVEGYSYLGLGNIFLFFILISFFFFPWKKFLQKRNPFLIPFCILSVIYILFALSNRAFINSQQIWNIPLPGKLYDFFSIFRASGRFIWPVFYFIVLFGIVEILRNTKFSSLFLAMAIVIQLMDIQPLYSSKHMTDIQEFHSTTQSAFWDELGKTNQHIVVIPGKRELEFDYEPIAEFAVKNGLTMNWGYFARADYGAIEKNGEQTWDDLLEGNFDNETVYMFQGDEWKSKARESLANTMVICTVDHYTLALSPDNPAVKEITLADEFTLPSQLSVH